MWRQSRARASRSFVRSAPAAMRTALQPAVPVLWFALVCEEWQGSPDLAEVTWGALMGSRWSGAITLRQWIATQPYVQPTHFFQRFPPSFVVEVFEGLVTERCVDRHHASLLETHVLASVGRDGQWTL